MVYRKNDLDTLLFCSCKESLCCLLIVVLNKACSNAVAKNLQECVCHTTTDDDSVTCLDKGFQDADL